MADSMLYFMKYRFSKEAKTVNDSFDALIAAIDESYKAVQTQMNKYYENKDFENGDACRNQLENINTVFERVKETEKFAKYNQLPPPSKLVKVKKDNPSSKVDNKRDKHILNQTIQHTLDEDATNIKPYSFKYNNSTVRCSSWANMLFLFCEIMYKQNSVLFKEIVNEEMIGFKKKKVLSFNEEQLLKPKLLSDTKIYIETNVNSWEAKKAVANIVKKFNGNPDNFKIFYDAIFKR